MRNVFVSILFGLTLAGLFVGCMLVLADRASAEEPTTGTFYQWVDPSTGAVSFTDDPKQIPPAVQGLVKQRSLEGLRASTTPKISHSAPAEGPYVPDYQPSANPNRLNDCTGPVTVRQERRQVGDYSRTFYVAYNECGQEIFTSPNPIELQVER